ncbi:hypothetical protein [Kitasatospora sp. NPDC088779]|uniref:hypothetical protein n=1 Tax=unclassified Kitasatospora TaxID=2633591 RepID=UPI00343CF73B
MTTPEVHGATAGRNQHGRSPTGQGAALDETDRWTATCSIQREPDLSTLPETDPRAPREAAVTAHGYAETGQDPNRTCSGAPTATGGRWTGPEPTTRRDPHPAGVDLVAHDAFVHADATPADVSVSAPGHRSSRASPPRAHHPPATTGIPSAVVREQPAAPPATP